MPDRKKPYNSKNGAEIPQYDEAFSPDGGENNTDSGVSSEKFNIPEKNNIDEQNESDKKEYRDNDFCGEKSRDSTKKSAVNTRDGNVLTKLVAGITVIVGAVLLLVNVVANKVPEADLTDFYVGADYIEYAFDVSMLEEDQILTLEISNDYESYTFPVNSGINSGTVSGLKPSTEYRFRVFGNFGYGSASLISKSVITAGIAPSAAIRSLSYTVSELGDVDLHIGVSFSDIEKKITDAQLVWLYSDGTKSDEQSFSPQNGLYDVLDFTGNGQIDFYLYATVDGVRSLYATDSMKLELTPQLSFSLVYTGEETLLRLSVLPMGSTIKSVRVMTSEEENEEKIDRQLTTAEALSFTYAFNDWTFESSHTVICRVEYEHNGLSDVLEMKRTAASTINNATCKLISVKDNGNEMILNLDADFESSSVDRTEVVLSDGNRTYTSGSADLAKPVSIRGLSLHKAYTATVRFWADDMFTEVTIGTLTPDYEATVQPSVWVSGDKILCDLKCDDPYGYYSNFAVSMTANGAPEISFVYDEENGKYTAPYALMQTDLQYLLTVSADTVRPSDMKSGISRTIVCSETAIN